MSVQNAIGAKWSRPAALLLLAALSGCRQGPGRSVVKSDLQRRLDGAFSPGTFQVRSLQRKGHYPLPKRGADSAVLVYFRAEVALLRARKLSAWEQTNVGSLLSVLGAKATSLRGIKREGNARGDVLEVRGAAAFARPSAGAWVSIPFVPSGVKAAGQRGLSQPVYRRQGARLMDVAGALAKRRQPAGARELAAVERELEVLVARAERRLGRVQGVLSFATGGPGGEYDRQGRQLVAILAGAKHQARAYASAGSLENCEWVHAGEVLFGYAQADIAAMAYGGYGARQGRVPMKRLRALAALYPEAVQLLTLAKSSIRQVADLAGKRVELGPLGSGLRYHGLQILGVEGVGLSALSEVGRSTIKGALARLAAGEVDAVFVTSTFPNPAIEALAATSELRLIEFGAETIAKLTVGQTALQRMTIPAGTYRGLRAPVQTVGVSALLIARDDAPSERVEGVLRALFANGGAIGAGSRASYLISKASAQRGIALPLHPAAAKLLESP